MIIRKFQKKDAEPVWKLIKKVFNEFVKKDCTKKGCQTFLELQTPKKNIERFKERDIFVALDKNNIIGIIEGNRKDKITRLFIDKKYHKKGIAKKLVNKIENIYRKKSKKIKVWSSIYAINFYKKLDYKKSRGLVKHKAGITYQPMLKRF